MRRSLILLLSAGFFVICSGQPYLVFGGYIFAFALYGLFWLCLPPWKRNGWGYKSSGGFEPMNSNFSFDTSSVSLSESESIRLREEFWNNPAFKSMGDNIYHHHRD